MQHIEIQTTQNVTIEYELATLQDRFVAMLIDVAIVIAMVIGIIYLGSAIFETLYEEDNSFFMIIGFSPIIGFLGYHLISEIVANGQSWGKKIMKLKVVRLDGAAAGLSDYLLRSIFHIVDTLFSGGIIAALLIASSDRKQRLGDMTANTVVIRLNPANQKDLKDVLNISTTENYTPTYLEIKHFQEEDILLIKKLITQHRKYPNKAHREALIMAAKKFSELLELEAVPKNKLVFLETLLKDYVVLTR